VGDREARGVRTSGVATIHWPGTPAHWRETGHPIIRSFEPGEDWFWNYDENEYYDGPELAAPECHPEDQSVPGPAGRVPSDWVSQLRARSD
jgi:hypothetical protein